MKSLRDWLRSRRRLRNRRKLARNYFRPQFKQLNRWLAESNEDTNFTYDLESTNQNYLAAFVAHIVERPLDDVLGYFHEILSDEKLAAHIADRTRQASIGNADATARFGRRIGWYAFVRAAKPKIVVETGIDKGLGSCVLSAALMRNASESQPGKYYGTDIDPHAGWLFSAPYTDYGEILYGDSLESLAKLDGSIDLFINDSDHSSDYERREYESIVEKLSPKAILIGDNAHVSGELFDFACRSGRRFLYFQEKPADHWYPGAGLGCAYAA